MDLPLVITTYLGKGGVGKTTLTGLLGMFFAGMGLRVAILDLDRQGSQSNLFGLEKREALPAIVRRELNIKDGLTPIDASILPRFKDHKPGQLFVVQGGPQTKLAIDAVLEQRVNYGLLSDTEVLAGPVGQLADPDGGDIDIVLIDLGPSDTRIVLSVLLASDALLMPTDCEWLSLERIQPSLQEYALVQRAREVKFLGIVPVKSEYHFGRMRRSKTFQATVEYLEHNFASLLLRDKNGMVDLPYDEEWKNAIFLGDLLFGPDIKSQVKTDALRFCNAVAARLSLPEVQYV